ncbi:MAG: ABC transporter ATP-binding protein [Desulfobulbaceae bacterium]
MALVEALGLKKTYTVGDIEVEAIRGVDFAIAPETFVSFVGPSGSGKSTLLNMIGCLDRPSSGTLRVMDQDVAAMNRKQSASFRGRNIGFIFQDFNLLPVLTVYENIEYPLLMVQDTPAAERKSRVMNLLAAVGMAEQRDKYPTQISGGQKQRVAIARALVTNPKLVLADEPTANLDHQTAYLVINLMKKMRDEFATTFIFSTHDPKIVGEAEIIHTLEDGLLKSSETQGGASHA